MKKINPCLVQRARQNRAIEHADHMQRVNNHSKGWLIGQELPDILREFLKANGAGSLTVEQEWDGAYSVIPASGDHVFVSQDRDELLGFLESVFGRVVRLNGACVELVPWNELLPSTTANQAPPVDSDSYW